MKKLLILSNLIFLSIILFMACNGGPDKPPEKQARRDVSGLRPDIVDSFIDTIFEKEGGVLDARLAVKMSKDYNEDISKGYIKGNNGRNGAEDATSIWFKLSTLKSFIEKAEKSLAGGSYASGLGVRIYYAKYPDDIGSYESLSGLSPRVQSRHTIFLVPTYQSKVNDENVDFNFDYVKDPEAPVSYNKLLLTNPNVKLNGILAFNRPLSMQVGAIGFIQNHGGLRPPPAGGDEVFPIGE